jgi:selenoprotein W-related protein
MEPVFRVRIEYCTGCKWLLRAAWTAQELLSTFEKELAEVSLAPGGSGVFRVELNGETVWDRKRDGGFPEAAELKRLVRDLVQPERDLGHCELPR